MKYKVRPSTRNDNAMFTLVKVYGICFIIPTQVHYSILRAVLSMNRSANVWCFALFLDVPFPFLFVVLCRNFVRLLVVMSWEASCEMLVMFTPNGCKIQHKSTPSNL